MGGGTSAAGDAAQAGASFKNEIEADLAIRSVLFMRISTQTEGDNSNFFPGNHRVIMITWFERAACKFHVTLCIMHIVTCCWISFLNRAVSRRTCAHQASNLSGYSKEFQSKRC